MRRIREKIVAYSLEIGASVNPLLATEEYKIEYKNINSYSNIL
jgi:hypothetical protein